jgi:hypothetical protein
MQRSCVLSQLFHQFTDIIISRIDRESFLKIFTCGVISPAILVDDAETQIDGKFIDIQKIL